MEWSQEDDILLAEVILRHIRENSTRLNAFDEAGKRLNRTPSSCGYRWYGHTMYQYHGAIAFAKKQRLDLLGKINK